MSPSTYLPYILERDEQCCLCIEEGGRAEVGETCSQSIVELSTFNDKRYLPGEESDDACNEPVVASQGPLPASSFV